MIIPDDKELAGLGRQELLDLLRAAREEIEILQRDIELEQSYAIYRAATSTPEPL